MASHTASVFSSKMSLYHGKSALKLPVNYFYLSSSIAYCSLYFICAKYVAALFYGS